MSPKSLLRHKDAISSFDDMNEGSKFRRVIPESGAATQNAAGVKKLIFCSGKVYYDLIYEREKKELNDQIAIARIEQVIKHSFITYPILVLRKDYIFYIGETNKLNTPC